MEWVLGPEGPNNSDKKTKNKKPHKNTHTHSTNLSFWEMLLMYFFLSFIKVDIETLHKVPMVEECATKC